eukprot:m.174263 g.174263  ORF g.174263 m.174263 type:complete len:844 (-) comp53298_c3_seq1:52-2583(-)
MLRPFSHAADHSDTNESRQRRREQSLSDQDDDEPTMMAKRSRRAPSKFDSDAEQDDDTFKEDDEPSKEQQAVEELKLEEEEPMMDFTPCPNCGRSQFRSLLSRNGHSYRCGFRGPQLNRRRPEPPAQTPHGQPRKRGRGGRTPSTELGKQRREQADSKAQQLAEADGGFDDLSASEEESVVSHSSSQRPSYRVPRELSRSWQLKQQQRSSEASRLDQLQISPLEQRRIHPSDLAHPVFTSSYLRARAKLLSMWHANCHHELTLDQFLHAAADLRIDENILKLVHAVAKRLCLINFGIFKQMPVNRPDAGKRVVVIGAGIAGLACARQLRYFGFSVTVLEARTRTGGRVHTHQMGEFRADLGAMVVTGFGGGNPLAVICKQANLDVIDIRSECPIFDSEGHRVPQEIDVLVEQEFNQALDSSKSVVRPANSGLSLMEAFESVMAKSASEFSRHGQTFEETLIALRAAFKAAAEEVVAAQEALLAFLQRSKDVKGEATEQTTADHTAFIEAKEVLGQKLLEQDECERKLRHHLASYPEEFVTPKIKSLVDWHISNLEYANAAPLEKLDYQNWDQDDDYEFTGTHLFIRPGFSSLANAMAASLDLKTNCPVTHIRAAATGVQVDFIEDAATTPTTLHADAVVVTVPLGVLKANCIQFSPELPVPKRAAIDRLGFGLLNKVVLCFDEVFWDNQTDLFGYCTPRTRGEAFLFWSFHRATQHATLVALCSGPAAHEVERLPDDVVIANALDALRAIFGAEKVPEPRHTLKTSWGLDPYARGTYSYVCVGASGDDYDCLASPVTPEDSPVPRLFFAGEHTNRNFPATVPGALLSGLREATRLADSLGQTA